MRKIERLEAFERRVEWLSSYPASAIRKVDAAEWGSTDLFSWNIVAGCRGLTLLARPDMDRNQLQNWALVIQGS